MPALIVDPALQAAVIRQFNLRGELAPFNLTENVVPIFDIGTLLQILDPTVVTTLAGSQGVRIGLVASTSLAVNPPPYNDTRIINSGRTVNPAAGAVIADTGQLVNGPHMVHWICAHNAALAVEFDIEWRNAANAATLATWSYIALPGGDNLQMFDQLTLLFAQNERLRIVTPAAVVGSVNCSVGATSFVASAAA